MMPGTGDSGPGPMWHTDIKRGDARQGKEQTSFPIHDYAVGSSKSKVLGHCWHDAVTFEKLSHCHGSKFMTGIVKL
jgi:hypothetical protein